MLEPTALNTPPRCCAAPVVMPPLAGPNQPLELCHAGTADPRRVFLETMVAAVFRKAYGASIESFYPELLGFSGGEGLHAVVGYRGNTAQPLFSEQYLDAPAEQVMSHHLQQNVLRRQVVEVGNLALGRPGQVRWVIAATTVFLHAAGYRWVLFTAVRKLFNAFQRLGMHPVSLAVADPSRLQDGGAQWGNYYGANPIVCAGNISAGLRQIDSQLAPHQPQLQALLNAARQLGSCAVPVTEHSGIAVG